MAKAVAPWRKRTRQRDAAYGERREAVIGAAIALFVERGYEATSMNDLAERLRVTKPTLYYYFDSKEKILLEIIERAQSQVADALADAVGEGGDGRARLTAFCRRYALLAMTPLGQCQIKAHGYLRGRTLRAGLRAKIAAIDGLVNDIVRQGQADGSLRIADARLATFSVFGLLNWAAFWFREDGRLPPERIAELLTSILIDGLGAPQR